MSRVSRTRRALDPAGQGALYVDVDDVLSETTRALARLATELEREPPAS